MFCAYSPFSYTAFKNVALSLFDTSSALAIVVNIDEVITVNTINLFINLKCFIKFTPNRNMLHKCYEYILRHFPVFVKAFAYIIKFFIRHLK